jgi:hypothetical protein
VFRQACSTIYAPCRLSISFSRTQPVWRSSLAGEKDGVNSLPAAARMMEHRLASNRARPILVTGAHRSGTTWVGAVIASHPLVGYIHEPFKPSTSGGICVGPFAYWFTYVSRENEEAFIDPVARTLAFSYSTAVAMRECRSPRAMARVARDYLAFARARRAKVRPLVKDPLAFFSADWLADRFDAQVIVLVRHPAAFASSLKRLGWSSHSFSHFLRQPLLMRDLLAPYRSEIEEMANRRPDVIEGAALLWKIIYGTAAFYQARHADWIFIRHEDISHNPLAEFSGLLDRLGLELTPEVRRLIDETSSPENPREIVKPHDIFLDSRANVTSWKNRLTPEEIERTRVGVGALAEAFYSADEW